MSSGYVICLFPCYKKPRMTKTKKQVNVHISFYLCYVVLSGLKHVSYLFYIQARLCTGFQELHSIINSKLRETNTPCLGHSRKPIVLTCSRLLVSNKRNVPFLLCLWTPVSCQSCHICCPGPSFPHQTRHAGRSLIYVTLGTHC